MAAACVRRLLAIACLLGGTAGAFAQSPSPLTDPPVPLPERVAQCQSCHGASGQPDNLEFPIIGGQNRAYLASALRAYRASERNGGNAEAMQPIAAALSDAEIDELAAFFSALRNLR